MTNKFIPKEKGYDFDDTGKRHAHYINGKRATGVTTILGVIAKPALIAWSARMAVDYIEGKEKEILEIYKDGNEGC